MKHKYKTCFYNVEPLALRLPDDCLRTIAEYCTTEFDFAKLLSSKFAKLHTYQHSVLDAQYTSVYLPNCENYIYAIEIFELWNISFDNIYVGVTHKEKNGADGHKTVYWTWLIDVEMKIADTSIEVEINED